MQNTNKVLQGQSFLDKVLELTGSIESVVKVALVNNTSITDDVAINDLIIGSEIVKSGIVAQLSYRIPATGITKKGGLDQEFVDNLSGIEYWAIELDFEVK